MLDVRNLSGGYGRKAVVKRVDFSVAKGEFFGILGPNGSGKTTLLHLINGTLKPSAGSVHLAGKPVESYPPKALARMMASLPQKTDQAFSFTVKETVLFGRYPYQKGLFRQSDERDEQIADQMMKETGVLRFAGQSIHELSGGEQQRVYLAQALAQEPDLLLLDEPTNFLDLSYQKQLLDLIKSLTVEKGLTVIGIFHDLNLAGLYCDRLLMMKNGEIKALDVPGRVIREQTVNDVYETAVSHLVHPHRPNPQITIEPERAGKTKRAVPFAELFELSSDGFFMETDQPLRTVSSSLVGAGIGWKRTFISRHVPKEEQHDQSHAELERLLAGKGISLHACCAAVTSAKPENTVFRTFSEGGVSLFAIVQASSNRPEDVSVWVMVNGRLTEKAFIQALLTASEAKAEACSAERADGAETFGNDLQEEAVLIAADGSGLEFDSALKASPLGALISRSVYECTGEAIRKGNER
ncbi:ABC transporter ATP-binding protein [Bacillus sp. JJ675]|uniref:ABC transporter ATP-binding protein n=1 Tax=Bacillus sp. JJ675 TaxID=3122972 RepID=UPI002FFE96FF